MNLKSIVRWPFETLVLLLALYYCLIVLLFDPVPLNIKLRFMSSAMGVWAVFLLFGVAFRKEVEIGKKWLFSVFFDMSFSRMGMISRILVLLKIGIPVFLVSSLTEYMLSGLFIRGGQVAIGFPLSAYSFSASRFLPANFIIDILVCISVLYFIGYILMKDAKRY